MPDSKPQPNRRWYRFSLRTLLVGMVLLTAVVGWVGWRFKRAQANRERLDAIQQAISWTEELGGTHDAITKTLRSRTWLEDLFDDPGSADDPTVRITISKAEYYGEVTDEELKLLKGLGELKELHLWDNHSVTEAGLAHLKGLTHLHSLDLYYTPVTDAGLENVKGLTTLKELTLGGTHVTDVGLEHLKGLTNLQKLDLSGTQVTDDGVAELRRALPNCQIHR